MEIQIIYIKLETLFVSNLLNLTLMEVLLSLLLDSTNYYH